MRSIRTTVLALTNALALLVAVPAFASHSWGSYHWGRASNPFTVELVDSTTPAWDVYLGPVSTDWTVSSVLEAPVVAGVENRPCKAISGKVRVCNAKYGFNGWLGLATIWIDANNHIVQGTAKVNDTYFNTGTYNNANAKRHVLCQEVGHTFGLGHQSAGKASCMNDKDKLFDADAISPDLADYTQLECIYNSHGDPGTNTCPAGTGDPHQSANGRTEVRRNTDGAHTRITFIIRA